MLTQWQVMIHQDNGKLHARLWLTYGPVMKIAVVGRCETMHSDTEKMLYQYFSQEKQRKEAELIGKKHNVILRKQLR